MAIYFQVALIIVSIVLTALVLLQAKGTGLGSIFGGDGGIYQTRRGLERTLFNATVVFAALFLVLSLLTVMVS
jgi:preprotein translocase subunit SecG